MKIKHYLLSASLLIVSHFTHAQTVQLSAWDFASGNTIPTLAIGVSAATVSAGGSLQISTALNNSFLVSNMTAINEIQAYNGTGTVSAQYIKVTIAPATNYALDITNVAVQGYSQNRARNFKLSYVDPTNGNIVNVQASQLINTPTQSRTFDFTTLTNLTGALELRFYIYSSSPNNFEVAGFGEQAGFDLVINGRAYNSTTQVLPGTWSLQGNTIAGSQFLGSINNQDVSIYANNSEKLRIGANGNIGIGTSVPGQKLSVVGDVGITGDFYQNGTKLSLNEWLKSGFLDPNAIGTNPYKSQLANNYENKLILNADVTEINSWVSAWQGVAVGGYNKYQSNAHNTNDMINGTPSYGIGLNSGGIVQVNGYNGINFLDNTFASAPSFSIKDGKVGIGIAVITAQTEKLKVNGNTRIIGNLSVDGFLFSNGKLIDPDKIGNGAGSQVNYMTTVVSGITYTYLYSPEFGQFIIGADKNVLIDNVSANVIGGLTNGQSSTNVQSSLTMVPTSGPVGYYYLGVHTTTLGINQTNLIGDKVGIGTSIPGAELDVRGNAGITGELTVDGITRLHDVNVYGAIHTNAIHVSPYTIDWPDYIFSKSYNLLSLEDLQTYINKNSHLPGLPSASDVKKNGIDLMEINKALLEKVEQLTLYTLQIKKELDELKTKSK